MCGRLMLHPSAYEPHKLQVPEDIRVLALGAKWGQIYGVLPGTPLEKIPVYGRSSPWEYETGEKAVAIASRYGVRLRKWLDDPTHAPWLDAPERAEEADLLVDIEWFDLVGFEAESAYVVSLDWYAPRGWLPPLVRLAACADA